jgi:hypothetical protein
LLVSSDAMVDGAVSIRVARVLDAVLRSVVDPIAGKKPRHIIILDPDA